MVTGDEGRLGNSYVCLCLQGTMMTLIILFAMLKAYLSYFEAVFQTIHKLLLDYAIILFCARVLEIF